MTINNLHHQKLFSIENVLGWPSSNKSSLYMQLLIKDYTSDMPAEFGISVHCVKCLGSLEFRPFNFKVQAHLLAMGSLTESTNLFTSNKSVPYPVFCDVCKHSWDAHSISPIQTEHLKFRSYLRGYTGIWKLKNMSLQLCRCTLNYLMANML